MDPYDNVHTRYSGLYTVEITTAVPGGYTNKRVRVSTNLRVHASFMFAGFKQGTAASAKLLVECKCESWTVCKRVPRRGGARCEKF